MPGGIAVVVLVHSTILVAIYHVATVPGFAAVIITSLWMEFVIAFPGVVDNFSLLPESLDLSGSGHIRVGNRHGEVIGKLFGGRGVDRVSVGWNSDQFMPPCGPL